MKINSLGFKKWIGLAVLTAVCGAAQAANYNFKVDINTSVLNLAPNSPFYLDFQLNPGNGTLPNTATVSNFQFTGGSATGATSDFSLGGSTSGDMGSTLNLSDAGGSAEIIQSFTSSTSDISFQVSLSQNSTGLTPDNFVILIDDNTTFAISTTSADGISLLAAPLGSSLSPTTLSSISTSSTTGADGGVTVSVTAVPEPSIWWLPAMFAVGLVIVRAKSRAARS